VVHLGILGDSVRPMGLLLMRLCADCNEALLFAILFYLKSSLPHFPLWEPKQLCPRSLPLSLALPEPTPLPRPAQTTRPIPAFAVAFRRERGASAPRMSPQKERALARGICSCRRLFFPYPLTPTPDFLVKPLDPPKST